MKYLLLTLFLTIFTLAYTTECDFFGFLVHKEIRNDYRRMVDIAPGNIGFNGRSVQQVYNPDTESEWFDLAYSKGIWAGGFDPVGNLKIAAATYGASSSAADYAQGPVIPTSEITNDFCNFFGRAWKIEGHQLVKLQEEFNSGNLKIENIPLDIMEWPAHKNPHIGNFAPDYEMAPYQDNNQDGIYNPLDGDLPIALTENPHLIPFQMTFSVFNDNTLHRETNGEPMSMEFHQLDYVVTCTRPTESEKSIFTRLKYINKGQESLRDFKMGIWDDTDLGENDNDYAGCSTSLGSSYAYNKDGIDTVETSSLNVPNNLAVVRSLVLLNEDLKNFIYSSRQNGFDPSTGEQFLTHMCGLWADGTPLTTGGDGYNPGSTDVTSFAFPDLPTDPDGWSMQNENINLGDLRTLTGIVTEDELQPEESGTVDFVDHVLIDKENLGLSVFDNYASIITALKGEFAEMQNGEFDCGGQIEICESDCVWPGDVDDSGIVNGKDIVLLGNFLGVGIDNGIARSVRSGKWFGWAGRDWLVDFVGLNGKYADVTGNGKINESDLLAATLNYNRSRISGGDDLELEIADGTIPLSMELPFNTIDLEDLGPIAFLATKLKVSINLGELGETLAEPVHGLSFEIKFDTSLVALEEDPVTLGNDFDFEHYYFSGTDLDLNMGELRGDNKVHYMMTNTDGKELSEGTQFELNARVRALGMTANEDRKDTLVMKFQNVFATNAKGESIEIDLVSDSLYIENLIYNSELISNVVAVPLDVSFGIFPNPAQEELKLSFNSEVTGQISINSMEGRQYSVRKVAANPELTIDISALTAGLYICRFEDENGGIIAKRFVKME